MKARYIIAALCAAVLVGNAPAVISEASAGPLCEHRSKAHIEKYGGLAKDSAEHIARGELPTCDPDPEPDKPREAKRGNDDHKDDGKSRYCRKHWYC